MLSTINLSHIFQGNIKDYQVTSAMKEHNSKPLKRPKTGKSSSFKRKWRQIPLALFPFGTKILPNKPCTTPKNPESINLEIKNTLIKPSEVPENRENSQHKKSNNFTVKTKQNSSNNVLKNKKSLTKSRKFGIRNTLFGTKKRKKTLPNSKRRSQPKNQRGHNLFPYNWPLEEGLNTSSRPTKTAQGVRPARMVRTNKTTPIGSPSKTSLDKKVLDNTDNELNQDLMMNEEVSQENGF